MYIVIIENLERKRSFMLTHTHQPADTSVSLEKTEVFDRTLHKFWKTYSELVLKLLIQQPTTFVLQSSHISLQTSHRLTCMLIQSHYDIIDTSILISMQSL